MASRLTSPEMKLMVLLVIMLIGGIIGELAIVRHDMKPNESLYDLVLDKPEP